MTQLPQRILSGEVEAPEVFCGGTPCQAFSVAGLRQSLKDDRGNLSLTFVDIANAIDSVRVERGDLPAIIFWENVPGVLSTKDNAFGCFLAGLAGEDVPLEPPRGKWADAGAVLGPKRTVAWRILDAQYFGLAQRRRRVFVVASARGGFDPTAILFESEGLRRDSAPSREAREVAPTIPARSTGGGGLGTDFDCDGGVIAPHTVGALTASCGPNAHGGSGLATDKGAEAGHILAFGGNNTAGPIDVATACNAHGGAKGRLDFESETFITHSLRGEGFDASEDGTGRGTPLVPVHRDLAPTLTSNYGKQPDSSDTNAGPMLISMAVPVGVTLHGTDGTQSVASYTEVSSSLRARIPSGVENSTTTAVLAPTLRAMGHADSHANGGGQMAVAWSIMPQNSGRDYKARPVDVLQPLMAAGPQHGNQGGDIIQTAMQVRRLTPVECERLQGFPDNYTAIPWRNKPASECPDGPRYKALGNSWAVPCVRWIGERIDAELKNEHD